MKKGMIKVSVFYPSGEDITFDSDYYTNKHIPLVKELLGEAIKGASVERGISGGAPGSDPVYTAVASLYFESIEAFDESFALNAGKIMADIPNFTNSKPLLQIGKVIF
ncbi:MAG: EthD family reductase [Bacteroidota bacterium]